MNHNFFGNLYISFDYFETKSELDCLEDEPVGSTTSACPGMIGLVPPTPFYSQIQTSKSRAKVPLSRHVQLLSGVKSVIVKNGTMIVACSLSDLLCIDKLHSWRRCQITSVCLYFEGSCSVKLKECQICIYSNRSRGRIRTHMVPDGEISCNGLSSLQMGVIVRPFDCEKIGNIELIFCASVDNPLVLFAGRVQFLVELERLL